MSVEEGERWLAPILGYDSDAQSVTSPAVNWTTDGSEQVHNQHRIRFTVQPFPCNSHWFTQGFFDIPYYIIYCCKSTLHLVISLRLSPIYYFYYTHIIHFLTKHTYTVCNYRRISQKVELLLLVKTAGRNLFQKNKQQMIVIKVRKYLIKDSVIKNLLIHSVLTVLCLVVQTNIFTTQKVLR